ncbi:galactokinase [Goodfellowiella coeruleoviolacea]|uniref:Galactokinase n=1 Tax=Goodfellowiella coeruleoviolacea TaxID=334858 RepID=A0AAE3GLW7_9PSEU|nr:galactokinase family protein [Goodfellowiella coeruleoviolacea]MCP2168388.1 galactokinase [Goodfellowiella coeruleoviolacea]
MRPAERAATTFAEVHGRPPVGVWSAPGRVNLIGEHTDYNNGFVLPFALPHRTAVAAAPRGDGQLVAATLGSDGALQHAAPVAVADLEPGRVTGWAAYVAGVAWVLRDQGLLAGGADLVIAGDVPTGAGLSSSHALECAVALALLGLAGIEVDPAEDAASHPTPTSTVPASPTPTSTAPTSTAPTSAVPSRQEIARWVQRSENDFVGAPTGLLDQTASLCCVEAHALFLDVRSFETEQVAFDAAASGLDVLVIDTRANHSHSESGYGERRRGCERAAELLGVPSLREVESAGLTDALARLPEQLRPLVRHVVTENDRVLSTVALLRDKQLAEVGPVLTASHVSLRDDYRISCLELDVAVDAALAAGALGARMIGGGFGGSAIALVRSDERESVERAVLTAFAERSLATPRLFTAVPSAGAGRDQ